LYRFPVCHHLLPCPSWLTPHSFFGSLCLPVGFASIAQLSFVLIEASTNVGSILAKFLPVSLHSPLAITAAGTSKAIITAISCFMIFTPHGLQ